MRATGSPWTWAALALALRLGALLAAADSVPLLDEELYRQRAEMLLAGEGFVGSYQSWVRHPEPDLLARLPQYPGAWQAPGYTVFVAAFLPWGGTLAVKLAQVLLGAATVALTFRLGSAWFGPRAGATAAALCALHPTLIAFSHYLWSETLFTFLLVALLLVLSGRVLPGAPRTGVAGALFGLCCLTRSVMWSFLPLLALWWLWTHRGSPTRALGRLALLAAVATAVIAPWAIRNSRLHGGLVWIETGNAFNLWRGNAPDAYAGRALWDPVPPTPVAGQTPRRFVDAVRAETGNPTPTDLEIVRVGRRLARRAILEDPARFLHRGLLKTIDLWNPGSFLSRHYRLGAYGTVSPRWQGLVTATAVVFYVCLMAAAAVGAIRSLGRPGTRLVLLLAGWTSLTAFVAFGLTRFRLPLMPLFCVIAASGLSWLWSFTMTKLTRPRAVSAGAALVALLTAVSCGPAPAPERPPNVLWIVWDTVRADRLSVYGYDKPTTPFLQTWSTEALVYEDCVSPAGSTVPSHASMFTGLLPSEHGSFHTNRSLSGDRTTVAELLQGAGYRTFLYAANPHIQSKLGFDQGFETSRHPWSPEWRERALDIVRGKIAPEDSSTNLPRKMQEEDSEIGEWALMSTGAIAQEALGGWLDELDGSEPWFAFLNYMEAHNPYLPPRDLRAQMMSEDLVERSYRVDNRGITRWSYCFGLHEYPPEDLAAVGGTYDAALRELDGLFEALIADLERRGVLDDTVIVLTSDHGEQLGEHHMLDHQFALYDEALHVPLIVRYPPRFAPGRSRAPVMNMDLFPTVLELAGLAPPPGPESQAVSLTEPPSDRRRLAEYPAAFRRGIERGLLTDPDWDPSPWERRLRALYDGEDKFICGSDGRHELYDRQTDPRELDDLSGRDPALLASLHERLLDLSERLTPSSLLSEQPDYTQEEKDMLEALGYIAAGDDDDDDGEDLDGPDWGVCNRAADPSSR